MRSAWSSPSVDGDNCLLSSLSLDSGFDSGVWSLTQGVRAPGPGERCRVPKKPANGVSATIQDLIESATERAPDV
jgi:hypothetical protein